MKLNDAVIGMKVEVVSLDHTYVGCAPFKIGDVYTVRGSYGTIGNTAAILDDHGKKWGISHKDIEPVIEYTHPMQEHLGKEVYVPLIGRRGFVVSYSTVDGDTDLLVDLGSNYEGIRGNMFAMHPQKNPTNDWFKFSKLDFLTEDDV
jgi:hypothetical protein